MRHGQVRASLSACNKSLCRSMRQGDDDFATAYFDIKVAQIRHIWKATTKGLAHRNTRSYRGLNQCRQLRLATLAGVTSLAAAISTSLLREPRLASTAAGFLHCGPPLFTCGEQRLHPNSGKSVAFPSIPHGSHSRLVGQSSPVPRPRSRKAVSRRLRAKAPSPFA